MFSCLRIEGSNGSLFRDGDFKGFPVFEFMVPKIPCLSNCRSNHSLFRNGWFQCFIG